MSTQNVRQALLTKERQIMNSAQALAEQTNDWQTIQAYMTRRIQDIELTAKQQEKLKRYQFLYNQLVTGKYTEGEILEMAQSAYGISYPQALQDMRDAKELFATTLNIDKHFELKLALELNNLYKQMAIQANDLRALAQLERNRVKLVDLLPEKEDVGAEDFRPHTNVFVFDPAILGLERIDPQELAKLRKEVEEKYSGKVSIPGAADITDAEIIEDGD